MLPLYSSNLLSQGDTHGSKADPPRFKDHTKLVCARHSRSGRKKYVKKHPDRVRKVPSRKVARVLVHSEDKTNLIYSLMVSAALHRLVIKHTLTLIKFALAVSLKSGLGWPKRSSSSYYRHLSTLPSGWSGEPAVHSKRPQSSGPS